jgi:hypothetical protein
MEQNSEVWDEQLNAAICQFCSSEFQPNESSMSEKFKPKS